MFVLVKKISDARPAGWQQSLPEPVSVPFCRTKKHTQNTTKAYIFVFSLSISKDRKLQIIPGFRGFSPTWSPVAGRCEKCRVLSCFVGISISGLSQRFYTGNDHQYRSGKKCLITGDGARDIVIPGASRLHTFYGGGPHLVAK